MIPGYSIPHSWQVKSFDMYFLEHTHEACGCVSTHTLGLFADVASAVAAIDNVRDMPGFRVYPDGFYVRCVKVYGPADASIPVVGDAISYACCACYDVDESGVEHETVYEGALYTCGEPAQAELTQWQQDGLISEGEKGMVGTWRVGEIDRFTEGFEIYHW